MLRTSGVLIFSTVLAAVLCAPHVSGRQRPGSHNPAPDAQRQSPGSQVAPIPEPEFNRWMKETADLLSKLNGTLDGPLSRPVDADGDGEPDAGRPKLTPAEQQAEDKLLKTLREICLTYLRAAPGQKESIRRMFDLRGTAFHYLVGYPSYAAGQIHSKDDAEWVLVGLASASIQDNRSDSRDTYGALGELYVHAFKAGIAPGVYFKRVAELSSRAPSTGGHASMHDFLLGFEKSAYFEFDVAPNLPRRPAAH